MDTDIRVNVRMTPTADSHQRAISDSSDGPGLYFVQCEDPVKPSKQRPSTSLRRHVMLNYFAKSAATKAPAQRRGLEQKRNERLLSPTAGGEIVFSSKLSPIAKQSRPGDAGAGNDLLTEFAARPRDHADGVENLDLSDEDSQHLELTQNRVTAYERTKRHRTRELSVFGNPGTDLWLPKRRRSQIPRSLQVLEGGVGQWVYYTRFDDDKSEMLDSARRSYVDKMWSWGRSHNVVSDCLSACMLWKRGLLTGRREQGLYLVRKGQAISSIQRYLAQPGLRLESPLLLAISMLAEFEQRERNWDTMENHIRAMKELYVMDTFTDFEWSFAADIDIRAALLLDQPPILPYYIPRQQNKPLTDHDEVFRLASRLAIKNAREAPTSAVYSLATSYDLLRKLHQLCLLWDDLRLTLVPPLGQFYDLAYQLRMVHVEVQRSNSSLEASMTADLMIHTIQIHLFVLKRHWSPLKREIRLLVMRKASELLQPDLVAIWETQVQLSSLLWVLFTLLAAELDGDANNGTLLMSLFVETCERMNVETLVDLENELRGWPWIDGWHDQRIECIWLGARDWIANENVSVPLPVLESTTKQHAQGPKREDEYWFVDGLESRSMYLDEAELAV